MGNVILRRGSEGEAVTSRRDGFLVKRSRRELGGPQQIFPILTPSATQGAVELQNSLTRRKRAESEWIQNLNQADGKRPYEPPQLTTISLRPEEAVLGNAKIAGGGWAGTRGVATRWE